MGYITNSDIEQRLGTATYVQLADDNADGAADGPVVDEARRGAEGEVDSYLARRFLVPVDPAAHPAAAGVLASIALDLVEFRLRCRRPPVPQDVILQRDAAVAWLRSVAEGEVELPSAAGIPANSARGVVSIGLGNPRILSRTEWDGF